MKKIIVFIAVVIIFLSFYVKASEAKEYEIINGKKCIYVDGTISVKVEKNYYYKEGTVDSELIKLSQDPDFYKKSKTIIRFSIEYDAPIKINGMLKNKNIENIGIFNELPKEIQNQLGDKDITYMVKFCYMEDDPLLPYILLNSKLYGFPALITSAENMDDYWDVTRKK